MPEIYTELTPPTTITHSLLLPFTSPTASNLLVAKTTLLQIYTTTTISTAITASSTTDPATTAISLTRGVADSETGEFATDLTLSRSTVEDVTKLALVAEYPLHGEITGLVGIGRGEGETHAVLLSFREARASLLVWDRQTAGLQTLSLHYYEKEEFASPVVVREGLRGELVSDPGNRAVALRFAGDMLAFLPVRGSGEEEEDGGDDDWDPSEDTVMEDAKPAARAGAGDAGIFYPSFVVSASQLDDAIQHVVSLTFLHEYREPTMGILYSPRRTWTGWLEQRKDTVCYIVLTLDLEQKACTPIMSVQGLPYDLFKVVPLQTPIGGSLLIGANEIIHVDQAGKTTGVAVNPYHTKATNFGGLADQSNLCLALEGANVVELEGEGGDILLIMKDGTAVIVGFKMDGRNVSGVKVTKIANHRGPLVGGQVSTAVGLGNKRLFIACTDGDSRVIRWKRKGERKVKPTVTGLDDQALDDIDVEDIYNMLDDDVDDDLYGGGNADLTRKDSIVNTGRAASAEVMAKGEYIFQTHDRLLNLGPLRDVTLGRPIFSPDTKDKQKGVHPDLEILGTAGPHNSSEDSGLSIVRRSVAPNIVGRFDFPSCQALWTVRARSAKTEDETAEKRSAEEDYDRFLFISKTSESSVFRVGDTFEEVRDTDFDADGETIEVGDVGDGARIVQIVRDQVRVYDCDIQLAQIIPMMDEETGEDGPPIVKATVCDPFVILIRDDRSLVVYKLDPKSLELAEEDCGKGIKATKYASGSLYKSRKGEVVESEENNDPHILALLTYEGAFEMYSLSSLDTPIFVSDCFTSLPHLIQHSVGNMSDQTPQTEELSEIMLTDLGDAVSKEPYLLARNTHDDLTIYKLFTSPSGAISFTKISNPILSTPRPSLEQPSFHPMISLPNLNNLTCVFLPGPDPTFIFKTARSIPHLHRLSSPPVRSLSSFHTAAADRGFVFIDNDGVVRVSLLPSDWDFSGPWSARKVYLNEPTRAVAWYDPMSVYVASTTARVPFSLEEEDGKIPDPGLEPGVLYPMIDTSALVIVSPLTWTIVDRYPFAHNEVALVVSAISLEVSEHTKELRTLIAVGTGVFRGEDHSARGGIYVFEVIEVVPEPGKPETNRKLKLIAHEDVRGTVSAICGVNGYLLAAQGQKVMVRGLKEDQSLLPVAFMDMSCYVSVAKSFDSLVLFGDVLKSAWFTGFSEEPYKMTLFGKDTQDVEVVAADFLPDGRNLFFVVADSRGDITILQYDPEHPKSLAGQRLIRRATFHTGHDISTLTLLPKSSSSPSDPEYTLLITARSGSLATLSILPENSYRRLNILQNQILGAEEQSAGCNPTAFRFVSASDRSGEMLKGVLDAGVVSRWSGLEVGKRRNVEGRAWGGEGDVVRSELVMVAGEGGVGYL